VARLRGSCRSCRRLCTGGRTLTEIEALTWYPFVPWIAPSLSTSGRRRAIPDQRRWFHLLERKRLTNQADSRLPPSSLSKSREPPKAARTAPRFGLVATALHRSTRPCAAVGASSGVLELVDATPGPTHLIPAAPITEIADATANYGYWGCRAAPISEIADATAEYGYRGCTTAARSSATSAPWSVRAKTPCKDAVPRRGYHVSREVGVRHSREHANDAPTLSQRSRSSSEHVAGPGWFEHRIGPTGCPQGWARTLGSSGGPWRTCGRAQSSLD